MSKRTLSIGALVALSTFLAACGGGTEAEPSTTPIATIAQETSTTSTVAPTTTITIATTTTTAVQVEATAIHELFQAYFDLVVVKDYEGARGMATGPAADYASFTEALNLISAQPDWMFETASGKGCCDVITLDDGHYATAVALKYGEANGSELAISNPSVEAAGSIPVLFEWGVDVGAGKDQPSLSQRLKKIALSPEPDPTSCFGDGLWAYIPGGSDTSTEVRIITIARQCDTNHDLVPQAAESRLYTEDGSVDVKTSTFLLEAGGDVVPVNTPTLYLAIFDVPRDAVSSDLIWDTPFDRVGLPATTFANFNIGAFELD